MIALTTLNQAGWVVFLLVPLSWRLAVFVVWFAADLATPYVAGWDARMGGHRHHIVERYGLFTIIVLGESIVSATLAAGKAIGGAVGAGPLLVTGLGGLIVVCAVWWIYFDFTSGHAPVLGKRAQYLWGYGHYFVFAALAAIGAGLSLSVTWLTDPAHVHLPLWGVAMVVGAAVAAFLVVIVLIESLAEGARHRGGVAAKLGGASLAVAAAVLAPVVTVPGSLLITGTVLGALVVYGVVLQNRQQTSGERG
jgi:low temperature requirement protein LtrA